MKQMFWRNFLEAANCECADARRGYFFKFSSTSGWLHAFSINTCFCLHHASRPWSDVLGIRLQRLGLNIERVTSLKRQADLITPVFL